jgi:D-proline reductase (dithiol) PrdB
MKTVDSYKYQSFITKQVLKSWISMEPDKSIPWVEMAKPVQDCTVTLISSGGIACKSDKPFDQEGERLNPWWGDPSYRVIPNDVQTADIELYHLHIPLDYAREDINCLLPVDRLNTLVEQGEVGASAPRHYSFMGYCLDPAELLKDSVPAMIETMREDSVDLVVLVPA